MQHFLSTKGQNMVAFLQIKKERKLYKNTPYGIIACEYKVLPMA